MRPNPLRNNKPHSGRPNRRYGELQRFIALMRPVLDDISGVYTPGEAAIVFDFNQWWALLEQPLHPQLDYIRTLCQWHEAFFRQNLAVDFCGPDADWSGYKLVVAPLMQLCGGERERGANSKSGERDVRGTLSLLLC